MVQYLPIAIMLVIGIALPIIAFVLAKILAPAKPEPAKNEIYECGLESNEEIRERMQVRYYLIAVLFVVFDVGDDLPFSLGRSLQSRSGLFGLIEMTIFIGILLLGYFYVLKKGALKWA